MTTTESRVREAFDKLSNLFIGTLNDITAIVIDAVPAEGQKTEAEVRGNLAGALGMPAETEWPELIAETDGRCRALGDVRAKLAAMTGRCRDLEMQREALQIGVAKDAARAASAELERDALLKEKSGLQADIDALMNAIREHDTNERWLRHDLDEARRAHAKDRALLRASNSDHNAAIVERERIRADLAKEIAAHLETKSLLKEMEDKAMQGAGLREDAFLAAQEVREVLAAGPRESTRDAAARVVAEVSQLKASWQLEHDLLTTAEAALAQARKEIADIKAIPFEFLHGLGYRAPNGGGSITVSAVREFVDVVFDGPPGPESGRFVEVEDPQGKSVNAGEWIDRGDGLWALRIPMARSSRPSVAIEMLDNVREAFGARSDETVLEAAVRLRAQAQADAPDDPEDSDAPVAAFAPAPVVDGDLGPGPLIAKTENHPDFGAKLASGSSYVKLQPPHYVPGVVGGGGGGATQDPEKVAQAAIDRTRHDIVKLTPEEVEALRLPDTGMFHGEPGAWYRRGDGLFIGYADLVPDFEGPGGPVESVMRRALSVISDLKERLEVTGKALAAEPTSHDPAALDEALVMLRSEANRLRSGAGGFGGGSPHAANLADAIEYVIACFR